MTVIAIQVCNGSEHRTGLDLVESLNAIHRVHIETDANSLTVGEADCSDLEYMRQHSLVALPPSPHPMVLPAIFAVVGLMVGVPTVLAVLTVLVVPVPVFLHSTNTTTTP